MNALDLSLHPTYRDQQRRLPDTIGIERSFLGTLMMSPEAVSKVPGFLEPDHFEFEVHAKIFEKAVQLHRDGKPVNLVVIKSSLPDDKIEDQTVSQYLAGLCSDAVMAGYIQSYAHIIRVGAVRRRLVNIAPALSEAAYLDELSIPDRLDELYAEFDQLRQAAHIAEDVDDTDAADEYLAAITGADRANSSGGVPLPLPELEAVLSDHLLREKRLYGLLSSSGEGKTSLTMQILYAAIMAGHPVLFLSYEQTRTECIAQMAAQVLGTEMRRQMENTADKPMLKPNEVDQCYNFARELMSHSFTVIDCKSEDTVDRLITFAKRFIKKKANGKTPLIAIDHMRAIKPEDSRPDEGTKALVIGQKLKSFAKETSSAVLVLQQRSGAGLRRSNPRPIASDLYGGEAARQPFDAIFYLYRAEHHMEEQLKVAEDDREAEKIRNRFNQTYAVPFGVDIAGTAELGCLKLRFGNKNNKRHVTFDAPFTRYVSRQRQEPQGRLM